MPFVAGAEFAGRIAANSPIPTGCPFKPGDRVFGATQGAFAERCTVKWTDILLVPDVLSYDEAAGAFSFELCLHFKADASIARLGLYVTWPTSYEALVGRAELKAGGYRLVSFLHTFTYICGQVNGFWSPPRLEAWVSQQYRLPKVRCIVL